jgi:hypothetical protein
MILPCLSKIKLRLLVVPWSRARMNCEDMYLNFGKEVREKRLAE